MACVKSWVPTALIKSAVVGVSALFAVGIMPMATHAASYTFTSDDCTGGCNPSGSVTVTQVSGGLEFVVTLGDSLQFLGGNVAAGIGASFAFDLSGVSGLSVGTPQTYHAVSTTPTSIHMDGAGTFNFGVVCDTCGSSGSNPPGGNSITFSVSGTGATLADLVAPNGTSFFAADVISCKSGVTSCFGSGTGNTGVIDATLSTSPPPPPVPLPPAAMLFGTALVGMGILGRRRRKIVA
jgi:hypothetical protein